MTNAKFGFQLAALIARSKHTEGAEKDLAKCIDANDLKYGFTESTMVEGEKLGIDWELVWSLPQKQIFRTTQLVNALTSATYKNLDHSHARILIAMHLAGAHDLTTDAVIKLAAGKRSDAVNTRGVSVSAVNTLFAMSHGESTVKTKVSNSVGVNGIFQALGVSFADPRKQNHPITLNTEHPIFKRFLHLINVATVGQLVEMQPKEKGVK